MAGLRGWLFAALRVGFVFVLAVVLILIVLHETARAQTVLATSVDPGDGNAMTSGYVQTNYTATGPGGAYAGFFVYGFELLNGSCGGGAIDYPARARYFYYGEYVGDYCGFSGSAWGQMQLPAVAACNGGYTLQSGACVPDTGGPVEGSVIGDFKGAALQDVVYALGLAICGLLGVAVGVRLT